MPGLEKPDTVLEQCHGQAWPFSSDPSIQKKQSDTQEHSYTRLVILKSHKMARKFENRRSVCLSLV